MFGSKTCPVQWFSNFRVVANSTLHKFHQQKLTICSDLQQHLHDHNGHLRVNVGCQSMVNDQVRARQRILEIQCFCSKQGFCAAEFCTMKIVADGMFFDLSQVSDMQALYPPRNTVFICRDPAELLI